MKIEIPKQLRFLADLYANDAPESCLLAEYPSSNSDQTVFQNKTKYIIHDPFPPPPRELLTTLGPHHLMCCWGDQLPVISQVAPPSALLEHWSRVFGQDAVPNWKAFETTDKLITLFPHESVDASQQLVCPEVNYELHSKEVIAKIDCPQAAVFDEAQFPCIAKLSHGYAGLGNFMLHNSSDEDKMRHQLAQRWPGAKLVFNSIIPNIVGDYGVQFYLSRTGEITWLGLTEQNFNDVGKWSGGTYSHNLQTAMIEPFEPIVVATAKHLSSQGYFGVVGIDILRDEAGACFLVDVNPRLTGITPFLLASRIFESEESHQEGIYLASFQFDGSLDKLIQLAESFGQQKVLVLSAFERPGASQTVCHLSVSSDSQESNDLVVKQIQNL